LSKSEIFDEHNKKTKGLHVEVYFADNNSFAREAFAICNYPSFFLPCILHNNKKQTWTHIATKTTTGVACQQAGCQSYDATCTNAKPARIYQTFNKKYVFFVFWGDFFFWK